jgi:hypothetical protein
MRGVGKLAVALHRRAVPPHLTSLDQPGDKSWASALYYGSDSGTSVEWEASSRVAAIPDPPSAACR